MTYSVRGFGLFLADGTLFAVYGQPQIIVEKSLLSTVLIAIDISFPTADINALTFGNTDFLNPPATTATRGVVELATEAEALEGEDVTRAITPAGLAAAIEAALYANDKIGTVKMWWGAPADIAIGWAICNGQTVARSDGAGNVTTPDLRDRVPVGVSGTHALGSAFGATSKTVNTTADGAHTPSGTLPAHNHGVSLTGSAQTSLTGAYVSAPLRGDVAGGGSGQAVNTAGLVDPGHDHDVTLTGGTDNAADLALSIEAVPPHQHGATMDVTQPSLALHFIMRV
jgi:microcystin-dependent protein